MDAFEQEEQALEDDLAAGNISIKEYNKEMQELQRSYRDEAEQASQQAYDNEMERW